MLYINMRDKTKLWLTGALLWIVVMFSFMAGFLGMMFSEKNREHFVHMLKNIRNEPPFPVPKKNADR
ncbi:hypothetical protein SAMN05444391_0802 [Thermocrinis minervae]|uniref:Uncharacterized protein n=1 Tax=Thermocrinis minervae TaxID=381751 RepID=A0A1M6RX94_9AQUI|nr:hypothetical protein SAMN05444391_0802 [Thermocrinis minervae]